MKISGIGKIFDNGLEAIKDISLDIAPGHFVSIIGRNGCGKSTLLRIIAELIPPTRGKMVFDSEGGNVLPPHSVGYVQQEETLFPFLTVRENIGFPLGTKSFSHLKPKKDKIVDSLLDMMNLREFQDFYPHKLSGGMKQRTMIARALSTKPSLLLLDEPFRSLDEPTKEQLQDELHAIWSEFKPSIVMATHEIEEAIYLSERVVILSDRPATVKGIVDVNFSSREDLRNSQELLRIKKEIRRIRDA